MMVNQALCAGCGACLDACSNDAIRMVGGKAFVDTGLCTSCQICAQECPTGALQMAESMAPVLVQTSRTPAVSPIQIIEKEPARVSTWGGVALALASQVLPRLVDVVANFLESRLASPAQERTIGRSMANVHFSGNRPRRRRQRGRRF